MFKKTSIFLAITIALVATGCETREPSGCLDQALLGEPGMLNPLLTGEECIVTDYIFQGLVRYDEQLQLVGQLAESWEVSPDNREWTFCLRQDVSWHDGEPFTANDVEFTFALQIFDESFPGPRDLDLAQIRAIEVLDDYRIKFFLAPDHELSMGKMSLAILPRHLYDPQVALGRDKVPIRQMAAHPRNWRPVGTGPYRFEEWQNQCIILERYENYYDGDCPYIQTTKFYFYPDFDTALSDLAAGRVDLLEDISPTQMETAPDLSQTHEYYTYQEMGCQVLAFNFRSQAFGSNRVNPWLDRRVRQAVAWAINREKIIAELLGGRGVQIDSIVPTQSWAYSPDIVAYDQDLAQAGQLLDQAGWPLKLDGWRYREGKRLSFQLTLREGNPFYENVAAMLKEDLAQVGIEVELNPRPWGELLLDCMDTGDFEMVLLGLGLNPDPDAAFFASDSISRGMNFGAYTSPAMDAILSMDAGAGNAETRRLAYAAMQKLMSYELPLIFLFSPARTAIASKNLKGIVTSPLGLCWPERWYFAKEN